MISILTNESRLCDQGQLLLSLMFVPDYLTLHITFTVRVQHYILLDIKRLRSEGTATL